jgi:hypothetical protein
MLCHAGTARSVIEFLVQVDGGYPRGTRSGISCRPAVGTSPPTARSESGRRPDMDQLTRLFLVFMALFVAASLLAL